MKLLKVANHNEGQEFDTGVFLTAGRKIDSNGQFNGWYIRLESPFRYFRVITSPDTFQLECKDCRWVNFWGCRTPKEHHGQYTGT